VTAQQLIELLVGLADERPPIGDQLQQRSHGDEGVLPSRNVMDKRGCRLHFATGFRILQFLTEGATG
jgi:hypothetical protein